MTMPQSHGVTEINAVTQKIIGHAIEVHRVLGPGLLETIYEAAMCIEFDDAGVKYERQARLPAYYKGRLLVPFQLFGLRGYRVLHICTSE
jgi:PD-(D/E)XK nuclease superfamily